MRESFPATVHIEEIFKQYAEREFVMGIMTTFLLVSKQVGNNESTCQLTFRCYFMRYCQKKRRQYGI